MRFEFISHKLLRLFAPFSLALCLGLSGLSPTIYRVALALQLAFYALSILAMMKLLTGRLGRAADAARTFVVLNTAALVAL